MAKKIIDITEKLELGENPSLMVSGKELEVNADAATVLKLVGVMKSEDAETAAGLVKIYELIFTESARKQIEELKLSFVSLKIVIEEAINAAMGVVEDVGEAETHTMI